MTKLSENAIKVAESRYFMEGEDWNDCSLRVADVVASNEKNKQEYKDLFHEMIYNMNFIPGGRILRNAGRLRGSLFNCYLLPIEDSIESIGQCKKEALQLWSSGGGIGFNFSTLRPRNAEIKGIGGESSGLVSFMKTFNSDAEVIKIGGGRRAAAIGIVDISHPEVLDFMDAKLKDGELSNFNLSIAINKEFIEAVTEDKEWEFKFAQKSYGSMPAREIWDKILDNMLNNGEPGLIHFDNLKKNNSHYFAPILGTNVCGEATLPSGGVCDLGSIVLPNCITGQQNTNWVKLEKTARLAVRFLDNIIDINKYVLDLNKSVAHNGRRLGLGVMGFAEYLFMKKVTYGSERAILEIDRLMSFIRNIVYDESVNLAIEKGAFPAFDSSLFCEASFVRKLPAKLRMRIREHGIRNVAILAIAPTGCQIKDTIISTDKGLLYFDEIGNVGGDTWQNINMNVAQENLNEELASKFYINGKTETKKIFLRSGNTLEATKNHKYRVLSDNKYIWKRIDELLLGDKIISVINFYNKQDNPSLIDVEISHFNQNSINSITEMNEKLAEFLGIYFGDGSNHHKGIRIHCNAKNKKDYEYVAKLGKEIFGIKPTFSNNGRNCMAVCFNSQLILKFLKINNLLKTKSKHIFVPKTIRMSSKICIQAFIDGLLFADGSHSNGSIYLDTSSKRLKTELITILRAIGHDVKVQEQVSGLGSQMYRIYLKKGVYKYRCKEEQIDKAQLEKLGLFNCVIDIVVNIEDSVNDTYDIEVKNTTTYIANSVVSHNTISLIADSTSGIEPLAAKAFLRKDAVGDRVYIHSMYRQFIESGEEVPDWYVDAYDLVPEDHFSTQACFQQYVDGAISKTILMPKTASKDDLGKLLLEYIRDLKGCTVYKDGSREGQPINKLSFKDIQKYIKNEQTDSHLLEEDVDCTSGSCEI